MDTYYTDDSEFFKNFKHSYVLVAIDTHPSMFKVDGSPSMFKNCMKALYKLSDDLLLKTNRESWSPFSVVLFDKEEKGNFLDFKDNMIAVNKLLKKKSSMTEDELKQNYMRNYDLDLAAFFQLCKKKFKEVNSVFYKRFLIFITSDPDPVNGDANKSFTALNEAKNFKENEISFQLIVNTENFDFNNFYTELLSLLDNKIREQICEDEEGLYEKLYSMIWFKLSMRKLLFYPFADDLSKHIKVVRKSYTKDFKLHNNSFVAIDGTPVKRAKVPTESAAGEKICDKFILGCTCQKKKRFFPDITFNLEEKVETEQLEFPIGYTLLYVCHRLTKLGVVLSEPKILEADSSDELPYFREFWQHCSNNNKVLVCVEAMLKNKFPKIVELIPKVYNNTKVFLVQRIPFANDLFEPEYKPEKAEEVELTPEQENVTDELIDRLTMEFSSSYLLLKQTVNKEAYVKAKLLDETRSEIQIGDFCSSEEVDQKLGDLVDRFSKCFPPKQGFKRKFGKWKK